VTNRTVKHRISKWLSLVTATAGAAAVCDAQITNPSFETSSTALTGWSVTAAGSGKTQVLSTGGSALGIDPVDGIREAYISNKNGVDTATLETFFGLASGALTSTLGVANTIPYGGSGIRQDNVFAQAGQTLTFWYDFATSQDKTVNNGEYDDFAFAVISPAASTTSLLGTVNTSSMIDVPGGTQAYSSFTLRKQTGWQSFSYTFSSTGFYSVGFGVADAGYSTDSNFGPLYDSGLYVDNVTLSSVPEPKAAMMAVALGLCALAGARRFAHSGRICFAVNRK
jgi:hypothetical protein